MAASVFQNNQENKPVAFANTRTIPSLPKLEDPVKSRDDFDHVWEGYRSFLSKGEVSVVGSELVSRPVTILRDTGASQSLMLSSVLSFPDDCCVNTMALVQGIDGNYISVPLYRINLKSELVTGEVTVGVVPSLPIEGVTFLLGNDLAGSRVNVTPIVCSTPCVDEATELLEESFPGIFPDCVVTRSQSRQGKLDVAKSEKVGDNTGVWLSETFFKDLDSEAHKDDMFSQSSLITAQREDASIKGLLDKALSDDEASKVPECYFMKSGVLMRKWRPTQRPANETWAIVYQVVVPSCYRNEILRVAHDIPLAGHLGIRKTQSRIMQHFYWPKLHKDVVNYCKTCHTCQMIGKSHPSVKPAPLIPVPAFDQPFSKVLVDCVGPLPRTKSGHNYLLTIMDISTRFPEAIPLKTITAKSVVEALLQFFTRYGLPVEIQSDQGSNFMSGLFQEVMYELGIKQLKSTPYHPESQGSIERFHQTMKNMFRAYIHEYPDSWDKGIQFVLFAIRDTPNESTGFSPFELVYGHDVRGPLKLIKERFLCEENNTNLLDYVANFRERLTKACEVAREHLKSSQEVMKTKFDRKAKSRVFKPGDRVLVLLPIPGEPLSARYSGPYTVQRKLSDVNYVITTPDRRKQQRVCHVNMLKEYFERKAHETVNLDNVVQDHVQESENDMSDISEELMEPLVSKLSNSQVLQNIDCKLDHLSEEQKQNVKQLLLKYKALFSDKPGKTSLAVHDVDVGNAKPIKQHPYRLNPSKLSQVREEIKYMLENDIIEPSNSCWSSPIVLIPKPDGSQRFCIDYRKVNSVTCTDSFPIPRIESCIDQVGKAAFVTKIDLLKGYWQVPLTERAKDISAFVTPDGLYQCKVMPFGMKNSGATFQRLVNKVISGLDNCAAYIDDMIVFSETWSDHLRHLEQLFARLMEANLVINLAKSDLAKAKITYLGHVVGQGQVKPRDAKVQAILEFPVPTKKRELLRFLGMSGFYRKFVANYSDLVNPLTNLLKKNVKFVWSPECQTAFESLKAVLSNSPVLTAPDFNRPFKLAIDASDVGVGAVLLQEDDSGVDKPVCYFSKKLNKHQKCYSTIEKETLSLVLAMLHFEVYVTNGTGEIIVYTDHNPLVFLEKFKTKSQRLFRWSLMLQPYSLKMVHVKGKNNVLADALSRV